MLQANSTRVSGGMLPLSIQRLLASDIENSGGIDSMDAGAKLEHLLDQRNGEGTNPYGETGDSVRRKIQMKVYRWKALAQKGRYHDEVLVKLGLVD